MPLCSEFGRRGSQAIVSKVPSIPVGTRVRVEMHDDRNLDGTLMSQSLDSVVVASPPVIRTAFAIESIESVRRSDGKSRASGAWKGVKLGSLIGAGATALVLGGAYLSSSEDGKDPAFLYFATVGGAVAGAFYGLVIGAIVGSERWTTVYSGPARVSYAPGPTGAPGVGVAIRF